MRSHWAESTPGAWDTGTSAGDARVARGRPGVRCLDMRGIVAYGAYLPYWRLERKAIGEALGAPAGSGARAVASYDQDTTSLGVEAARSAVRGLRLAPEALYF